MIARVSRNLTRLESVIKQIDLEHIHPFFCPKRLASPGSVGSLDYMALIQHFHPTKLGDIQIHEGGVSRRLGDRELEEAWAAKSQERPLPLPPWFLKDDVICSIVEATWPMPWPDRTHLPINSITSSLSPTPPPELTPGLKDNLSSPESIVDVKSGLQLIQQVDLPSKSNKPSPINPSRGNPTSLSAHNRPISAQGTRLHSNRTKKHQHRGIRKSRQMTVASNTRV